MAEQADARDLKSRDARVSYGFDSRFRHQRQVAAPNYRVATSKIRTSSHDGGVRIYHHSLHQPVVPAPQYRVSASKIRTSSTRRCISDLFLFSAPYRVFITDGDQGSAFGNRKPLKRLEPNFKTGERRLSASPFRITSASGDDLTLR